MNTLETIIKHGLSIRQVPLWISHTYCYTRHKPGNKVSKVPLRNITYDQALKLDKFNALPYEIDHEAKQVFRLMSTEIKIPVNAGYWMVQAVTHTSSTVQWDIKKHHLSPTLDAAVASWLKEHND